MSKPILTAPALVKRRAHEDWQADSLNVKGTEILAVVPRGSRWFHSKTGGIYVSLGLAYDAERGRWMVGYQHEDDIDTGVTYYHLPEDFLREGRFARVAT